MRIYRLASMLFLLLFSFTPMLKAQSTHITATKESNIRKLLNLMDAKDTVKRSMETQISIMKTKNVSGISPNFWDEVLKEYDYEKYIDLLIPVYDKHFSDNDVEVLIAFYKTPLGKKLASESPQILAESLAVAEKYGKQLNNQVIQRMQAEGTFPKAAPAGDGKPAPPRR